jgi:hypothetical protein
MLSLFLSLSFFNSGDGNQGLTHARKTLYHWAKPPQPRTLSFYSLSSFPVFLFLYMNVCVCVCEWFMSFPFLQYLPPPDWVAGSALTVRILWLNWLYKPIKLLEEKTGAFHNKYLQRLYHHTNLLKHIKMDTCAFTLLVNGPVVPKEELPHF